MWFVIGLLTGCVLLQWASSVGAGLMVNLSPSLPRGLYRLTQADTLQHGQLVAIHPTAQQVQFLSDRGYVPAGWPLLKTVAGMAGDTVCISPSEGVRINGILQSSVLADTDGQGRSLPQWHGCHVLAAHELFVLNRVPTSLDSRYLGPLPSSNIRGIATLIWEW